MHTRQTTSSRPLDKSTNTINTLISPPLDTQAAAHQIGKTLHSEMPESAKNIALNPYQHQPHIHNPEANDQKVTRPQPQIRVDVSDSFSIQHWRTEIELSYEPDSSRHYMFAYLHKDRNELRFTVRAQKDHSLGSGKDMVGSLLRRLDKEGISYSTIKAHWSTDDDSVNTAQFKENLSQGMSPTQAAKNTWTGKLLQSHGWQVNSIKSNDDNTSTYVFFK